MNDYFKKVDLDWFVYYEGNFLNLVFEDLILDVKSCMYVLLEEIVDYFENKVEKLFILCEYMYDMGNLLGGMDFYMMLFDCYEMY